MSEAGKMNLGQGPGMLLNQAQKTADSKEYLVEGAKLYCVNGGCIMQLKLPTGHGYTSGGKKKANCKDCKACENIPYFGECRKNEKDHKCEGFMELAEKWENTAIGTGKAETVGGEEAISMSSVLLCKKGGVIIPVTSGQGYDEKINWAAFLKRYQNVFRWVAGKNMLCQVYGKDPINMNTGNYIYEKEDLVINGNMPLSLQLFYNAMDCGDQQVLGEGWNHNYGVRLIKIKEEELLGVVLEDGRELPYCRKLGGSYAPVMGDGGILSKSENGYRFERENGTVYEFDQEGKVCSQKDRNGNNRKFTYNSDGLLECVDNGTGGRLNYTYNQERKLIYVQDHTGRKISLKYQYGKLRWFTNSMGNTYTYEYNENGKVNGIITPRDILGVKNEYDGVGRVRKQIMPDGGVTEFRYDDENNRTYMLEQNGNLVIYECDKLMRNVRTIYEDGEEIFEYNDRNQKIRYTDKNGNTTQYAYDNQGNLAKVIDPLGQKFYMTYDKRNLLVNIKYPNGTSIKNSYNEKGKLIETVDRQGYSTKIEYVNGHEISRIIQADGTEWGFQYDGKGHISQITDPLGNCRRFFYNELGQQEKYIDGNGNQTLYSYNKAGKLEEITNAAGDNRRYQYNDSGRIIEIKDFDNSIHQMEYDACSRCCKYTDPEGNVTSYEYDGMGKMVKKNLPNGGAYLYSYSGLGNIETAADPLGNTTKFWHDPNGNCIKIAESNGAETLYAYDALNRPVRKTEADGLITTYEYNSNNRVVKVMDNYGNQSTIEYDDTGNPVGVTDVYGNHTLYSYNCFGQIVSRTDGAGRKTDYSYYPGKLLKEVRYCDGADKEFWYDGNGNAIKTKNQDGFVVYFAYDCLNRCIEARDCRGYKKSYTYDKTENITSLTDANGNMTQYEYSLGGALKKITDPLGSITCYEYDSMSNLISAVKSEGKQSEATVYQRNLLGEIESVTNALGNTEYYEYDTKGNITKKTDRDGGETYFSYSLTGLLEKVNYPDGREALMEYDGLRRLRVIKDWQGCIKIDWGIYKHLKSITDHKERKVSYEFEPMGNLTAITYPNERKVKYSYDACLRLLNLTDGDHAVNYRYNKNGLLEEKLFSNELKTIYSYNQAGKLTGLVNQCNGKILDQYTYSYDPVGNKTDIVKRRSGARSDNGHFQYEYNSHNQIIRVLRDGEALREYEYDVFGNRIFKREGENETFYTYNLGNQLVKEIGNETKEYEYDLRGNLSEVLVDGRLSRKYEFDAENHMSGVYDEDGLLSIYQYNALGHRIGKKVRNKNLLGGENEQEYVLDFTKRGKNLLEKIENGETEDYVWDKNVIGSIGKYTKKQFLNDEMGSTVRACYSNGRQAGVWEYDEFGETADQSKGLGQTFGFTGYQWDESSRTYYAQAREYSSSTGTFISEDAVNDIIGLPQTLNHYVYCHGNPNKWIDVNGQFAQQEANQLIADYLVDEYGRSFEAWKDDISDRIDQVGKAVHHGVDIAGEVVKDGVDAVKNGASNVAASVNEFWNNNIYGEDIVLLSKGDLTVKSHTGGSIIVTSYDVKSNFKGWSINLSTNIPNSDVSIGFNLSGKNADIDSWKTKNYIKVNDIDKKISYSAGVGYNKEGVYFNESWGGGTDTLPLVLPNGVTVDSHTNVTWSVSKDETMAPWNTVLECVGVVVLFAVAIALIPETGGASVAVLCGV
ncbi:DUF6531 domain-containing protein [Lacrimispora indolis]|uniref:DUF6531 domain-containing protein n=1 Tax=Lacrimispora indolis TaxID=69825 RepID=UPI0004160B0A|nr:DUF6531 domain-containing protein [[Clostridium] methoxybenzovorans]